MTVSPSLPSVWFIQIQTLSVPRPNSCCSKAPPHRPLQLWGVARAWPLFFFCPSNFASAVTLSDDVFIMLIIYLDHHLHIPFISSQLTVYMWDIYFFLSMLALSLRMAALWPSFLASHLTPCVLTGPLSFKTILSTLLLPRLCGQQWVSCS